MFEEEEQKSTRDFAWRAFIDSKAELQRRLLEYNEQNDDTPLIPLLFRPRKFPRFELVRCDNLGTCIFVYVKVYSTGQTKERCFDLQ